MDRYGNLIVTSYCHVPSPWGARAKKIIVHREYNVTYEGAKKIFGELVKMNSSALELRATWQEPPIEIE